MVEASIEVLGVDLAQITELIISQADVRWRRGAEGG